MVTDRWTMDVEVESLRGLLPLPAHQPEPEVAAGHPPQRAHQVREDLELRGQQDRPRQIGRAAVFLLPTDRRHQISRHPALILLRQDPPVHMAVAVVRWVAVVDTGAAVAAEEDVNFIWEC